MATATKRPAASQTAAEQSITVKAADLVRAIADALPFASTDATVPIIHSVWLEASDGSFSATATNRHALGHSRAECVGSLDEPVIIGAADARLITRLFKPSKRHDSGPDVTITTTEAGTARFTYTSANSLGLLPELGIGVRLIPGEIPNYARLLKDSLTKDRSDLTGPVGLNPDFLASFARVQRGHGEYMRLYLTSETNAVVVQIGDRFVGMLMPIRLPVGTEKAPTVSIGHESATRRPSKAAVA